MFVYVFADLKHAYLSYVSLWIETCYPQLLVSVLLLGFASGAFIFIGICMSSLVINGFSFRLEFESCQGHYCFLKQEALPSLLGTGWFQEQI